ncbi:hypothetical protein ABT126_44555 [Streptomyces sp. NPDC002012]
MRWPRLTRGTPGLLAGAWSDSAQGVPAQRKARRMYENRVSTFEAAEP